MAGDWLAVPPPTAGSECDLVAAAAILAAGWTWVIVNWAADGKAAIALSDVAWIIVAVVLIRLLGGRLRILPRTRQGWLVIPFVVLAFWAARNTVEYLVRALVDVGPDGVSNDIAPGTSLSQRWLQWTITVGLTVVVEEFLYRAAVPTVLRLTRLRWHGAVIVSSLAWGLHHGGRADGYNIAECLGITAGGLVIGYAVVRFRCLAPALFAHAVNNLATSGDTGPAADTIAVIVAVLAAAAGWASGMRLLHRLVRESHRVARTLHHPSRRPRRPAMITENANQTGQAGPAWRGGQRSGGCSTRRSLTCRRCRPRCGSMSPVDDVHRSRLCCPGPPRG